MPLPTVAPRRRQWLRLTGERGSATAELAAGMPVVVLLLAAALFAVNAAVVQIRCTDAARDGALAASRGGSGVDAAQDRAPDDAVVEIDETDDLVTVRVSVGLTPWDGWLPGFEVRGEATTEREPSYGT
ncbi:MAG TPA: pilus assembly protein [Candidatus Stackebrandtia excrementipullorum]|nr:pilus assembly protein [Candidatus Stackebrandtia excrementipullorum]